jgi:hypothetical protein
LRCNQKDPQSAKHKKPIDFKRLFGIFSSLIKRVGTFYSRYGLYQVGRLAVMRSFAVRFVAQNLYAFFWVGPVFLKIGARPLRMPWALNCFSPALLQAHEKTRCCALFRSAGSAACG